MRTLVPGYPAVLAGAGRRRDRAHARGSSSAGRRGCSARRPRGSTCWCSTRRISTTRPGNPYVGPARQRLARQRAALRRAVAGRGRGSPTGLVAGLPRRTSCTPTTGRRAWPRPICTIAARRRARGTVMTVHNLAFQGRFPPSCCRRSACRRRRFSIDGVEYYGGIGFLKAGLALRRPHHDGVADLRRRDPHRRRRHGTRRAAAPRAPACSPASSTASTTPSGTRRPTPSSRRRAPARRLARRRARTRRRCRPASASRSSRRRRCSAWSAG